MTAGEFLILLGPSGCGKSTALRMLAGLEDPTSGRITIAERDVTEVEPQDRDVAMVFQSYALYPHRSVRQNIEFPLRTRKVPAPERAARVEAVAAQLGLTEVLDRRPGQLSGGQRQRVAVGRALVREARVLLMDEPLSNLDALTRVRTRAELTEMHRRLGVTIIYVTHDQTEALTMGTRIAVMNAGRLEQVGTPEEIYSQPASAFVAGFIGTPPMNLLPAEAHGGRILLAGVDLPNAVTGAPDGPVLCGVRPEHISHSESTADTGRPGLPAQLLTVESLGHERLLHWQIPELDAAPVIERSAISEPTPALGSRAHLHLDHLHLFDPVSGARR